MLMTTNNVFFFQQVGTVAKMKRRNKRLMLYPYFYVVEVLPTHKRTQPLGYIVTLQLENEI